MDEYIDRNALLKAIDEILYQTDPESEEQIGVLKCRTAIREIEDADVQHVVTCEKCKYHYRLEEKLEKAKSEAREEFAGKVDELLNRYSHIHEAAETAMADVIECDNETIEMQSVWDVHTLIANEMGSDYEEMNRLQDNIETIAKERLLKEIEKNFRLLIKEMTGVKL